MIFLVIILPSTSSLALNKGIEQLERCVCVFFSTKHYRVVLEATAIVVRVRQKNSHSIAIGEKLFSARSHRKLRLAPGHGIQRLKVTFLERATCNNRSLKGNIRGKEKLWLSRRRKETIMRGEKRAMLENTGNRVRRER